MIHKYRKPLAGKQHLLASTSAAVLLLASAAMASAQQTVAVDGTTYTTGTDDIAIENGFQEAANDATITIDVNGNADDAAGFSNDAAGNTLTITIVNSDTTYDALDLFSVSDIISASNGGALIFRLGEGDTAVPNPASPNTGLADMSVGRDVTEQSGGTVSFVLGSTTTDTTGILRFIAGQATQTIDAAISVVDANDFALVSIGSTRPGGGTTIFTDTITLGTGDGIVVGDSAASGLVVDEDITAIFQADVTSPVINVATTARADATVILGEAGASTTVTGTLDVVESTNGAAYLVIADGATVRLVGDITTSADRWDNITIGGGTSVTQLTVLGNVADNAPITLTDQATLVFDSSALSRTVDSAINADAAASTTTLQVIGTTGNLTALTFNEAVGATHAIDTVIIGDTTFFVDNLFAGDLSIATDADAFLRGSTNALSGDLTGNGELHLANGAGDTLTFNGGTQMQTIDGEIVLNNDAQGIIQTANTAGLTFNGIIGRFARAEAFQIGQNNVVTFNNTVATEDFTVQGTGSTVTFNGTGATQVTLGGGSSGVLTLDAGTIVLGSNIGNGDTVFDITGGVATQAAFTTTGVSPVVTIRPSSNFTSGSITLIDGDVNETLSDTKIANFTAQGSVLATYTLDQEGANNQDLILTAAARSTAGIASFLGVTTTDAENLQTVLGFADAATTQAINEGLDAGGTTATQTVQQLGTQSQTVGAGAATGQQVSSQNRELTGNQLGARRGAGESRFASAFAATGETGFSGGDPMVPSSSRSVWSEAFGGIADAQGNGTISGYDASFAGAAFGVDGAVTDNVVLGLMGSYSYADVDGEGAANTSLQSTTYLVGAYGSYTSQTFYLDGFASYAFGQHDTSRVALGQTYTADYESSQFTVALSGGVPLEMHTNVYLTPNASLTWNHFDADSYTETGGGLTQRVTSDSSNQLTGTIGTRLHAVFDGIDRSGTSLIPELRVGLSYDILDDDAVSTAAFTGGGASYQVTGLDTDDIGALIGLGLALENPGWSASLAYNGDIRSDLIGHTASAQVRLRF